MNQNTKFYSVSLGVVFAGLLAANSLMNRIHGRSGEVKVEVEGQGQVSSQISQSPAFRDMTYSEAIEAVRTPEEATRYIRTHMIPTRKKGAASFRKIHERRYGNCGEAAIAAAALLSDNGFPPTYLSMKDTRKKGGHAVFLYEQDGKWGTIGINSSDNKPPAYTSLEDIAIEHGYDTFRLATIGEGIIPDWINADRDLTFTPEEMARLNIEARFQRVR